MESVVPFDVKRKGLQRAARKAGLKLQTIADLRPLSDAIKLVGREAFIERVYLAVLNKDTHARAWWAAYEDLKVSERKAVPLDEICLAAGVRPEEIMAAAISAGMVLGARVAEMVYGAFQPRVVGRMAKSALRIGGKHADVAQKDRMAFLQHSGFIPTPNRSIVVNATANATSKAQAAAAASAMPSVPSFLQDLESAGESKERIQRKLLEHPVTRDAEIEE